MARQKLVTSVAIIVVWFLCEIDELIPRDSRRLHSLYICEMGIIPSIYSGTNQWLFHYLLNQSYVNVTSKLNLKLPKLIDLTRMVQLPATAAIEYVAACCRTRIWTRTKTKIGTITKTVRGAYARSPQVQCVYEPSRLSVPSIVAWRTNKQTNSAS